MQAANYTPTPLHRRRGPKTRITAPKKIGVWFAGARRNPSLDWFQEQLHQIQSPNERPSVEFSLLFSHSPDELPRPVLEHQVDGIIIQGVEPSAACFQKLADIPHVWFMTRRTKNYAGDFVEPDNDLNGYMAADYLHSHGHKVVAAISTDPSYSAIAWRISAFIERATELKMSVTSILGESVANVSYLQHSPIHNESEHLARRVKLADPRPTGLYVPADHFCGSFFRAMRSAGLQPGRDYQAVLGNYNPMIYHNLDHLPAALDINLTTLVRKVVDQLVWRIENPQATGRIGCTVAPSLISTSTRTHSFANEYT